MILPLLFLLAAQNGEYNVNDFIARSECSTLCDISPAIDRVLKDCAANPPYKDAYDKVGCDIYLPPGQYSQSRTIVLDRNYRLQGAGGWGPSARTLIQVRAGVTAVRVASGGSRSEIRDIAFISTGVTTSTAPYYGIEEKFRIVIDGVWIRGFVQGLRIDAGALRQDDASNANGFWVTRSRFDQNKHAGIYIDGPDVNAGYLALVDVSSNCQEASKWSLQLGSCAGLIDSSFLGVTIVAPHAAANVERDGFQYPAYISEGDNNHTIFVGPYSERGQATSILSKNAIAIGGLSAWGGFGLRVDGTLFSGATFRNDKDPKNIVELNLGRIAASGTFLEFKSLGIDSSRPLRLKADPGNKRLIWDIANQLRVGILTQAGHVWWSSVGGSAQ